MSRRGKLKNQLPPWAFEEDVSLTKSERNKLKGIIRKGANRWDKEHPEGLPKKKRK